MTHVFLLTAEVVDLAEYRRRKLSSVREDCFPMPAGRVISPDTPAGYRDHLRAVSPTGAKRPRKRGQGITPLSGRPGPVGGLLAGPRDIPDVVA